MPYVSVEKRVELVNDYKNQVREPGDLNYLVTLILVAAWKRAPVYASFHEMYKSFVLNPEKNESLTLLARQINNENIFRSDVFTAAALAFFEFYRRVGHLYEDNKILENGDLVEYQEILKPLFEKQEQLVKAHMAAKPSPLIIPAQVVPK